MDNIYKPPKSQLDSKNNYYTPSAWWRILLFILVPVHILGSYYSFTDNEYSLPIAYHLYFLGIYTIYLTGLFGLAFQRKIGIRIFWIWFLPVLAISDIIDIVIMFMLDEEMQGTLGVVITIILFPILLITWWSIYVYSNKFNKI